MRTIRKQKTISRLRRFVVETLERRDTPSAFTQGDLVVYRIGDGTTAPSGNGSAVFLDEYTTGKGQTTYVQTIGLDTIGLNAFIASGTATSEGALFLSPDSQFLSFMGYNIPLPNGTTPASNNTAARTIAVVDKSGTVTYANQITSMTASKETPRGAATIDGQNFWVTGSTGGNIRYVAGPSDTTGTQITTTPGTPRAPFIAGGQLYVTSSTAVNAIGTGLPTTSGNTGVPLSGVSFSSGYGMFFADLSNSVAGLDTLYVADDSTGTSGGGIRKFTYNGTSWSANGTETLISGATSNGRGLTGSVSGSNVTIYATTATKLFSFTDNSGYGGTINNLGGSGTLDVLTDLTTQSPVSNAVFRGVAFVPRTATSATINSLTPNVTSTSGTTVTYTETLSAAITGLATSNFTLTTTAGSATGTVGTPTTSNGGLTWTIPVTGITGLGTIRLDVVNSTGVTPPMTNVPYTNGGSVNITGAGTTLDVQSGQAIFSAGLNQTNNVTLSVSGGTYTINDTLQPIVLTAAAVTAGWTGSGSNTVTGPDAATSSLLIAVGSGTGADTFTVNSVNDPLTVTGNTQAGSAANFPVSLTLAGAISVTGFDTVSDGAGVLLTVSNLTLGGNTVGLAGTPIHTKSTNITATAGDGGMNLLEDDGANFTLTTTGVGTMTVVNTTGTLTVAGASTFGSGAVSLSSGDGVAINAALGDLASSGTVAIAANTDGAGSQGFSMSSSGSIRTLDGSSAACSITVNLGGGGTGDATVNNVQVGGTGTIAIESNAGSILGTATNVLFAGGGFPFQGSVTLHTSGAASAIGTSGQHLIMKTGNVTADAGSGGIYLEKTGDNDIKVAHLIAQGAGAILLHDNSGSGNGIEIAGMVNTGSGNITLQADDGFQLLATGSIGDGSYSGKIQIDVNLDGQNAQTYLQANGTLVQTTSTASDAVVINVSSFTLNQVNGFGGATLGNITVGNGGGITVNVAKMVGPFDAQRAGYIAMESTASVLNAGPNGFVMLTAKDNSIGTSAVPIKATAGTISAVTNSTAAAFPLAGQAEADVFIESTGAVNFSGTTTDAGTRIGVITVTTDTGGITLNGVVQTDTGTITLISAAGIDQSGGTVTTLGTADYQYTGQARFSTAGNSIATLTLSATQNLRVDGGVTLSNPISIDGTLSGAGTLAATVNVAATGKVSPGDSPGKLNTGSIAFVAGSQFIVELNGNTAGVNYDQLAVTGGVDVTGAKLVGTVGGPITPGSTLIIIDNDTNSDPVVGKLVDGTNTPINEGGTIIIGATTFTVSYVGGDGNDVTLKAAGAAAPPPTVTNLQIDNGTAQRSMVRSLTVTFSEAVTFTGPVVNAFALNRNTVPVAGEQPGVTGLVNIAAAQGPGNTVVLTFLTSGPNPVNGVNNVAGMNFSLPDGRYTLTINASLVTGNVSGSLLDGDFNSTPGGNYVLASASAPAASTNIFRYFGDQNGDGAVGTNDFSPGFKQANGTTPVPSTEFFDYNENNNIGTDDFTQFKLRFQVTFP
jgi:hypothetical protein